MWKSATTREQLQENINRLEKHSPVIERPKENILVSKDVTRRLSILRENEITSNLAFLSATSDDSLKVMAVCVEESLDGKGMTIRISSNTGDLSKVTSGFKALAKLLEKAAQRGTEVFENCL